MYDFVSETWTDLAPMQTARFYHGCGLVKRSDGTMEAVVAGGDDASVEIYNFETNQWR